MFYEDYAYYRHICNIFVCLDVPSFPGTPAQAHFLSFIFHTIPSMLRLYPMSFDPKKGREKLILRQIYFTLLL